MGCILSQSPDSSNLPKHRTAAPCPSVNGEEKTIPGTPSAGPFVYSCPHSCIRVPIRVFVSPFVYSCPHSHIRAPIRCRHSYPHSCIRVPIRVFVSPFVYSCPHSLPAFVSPFVYSCPHSLPAFVSPFVYSCPHSLPAFVSPFVAGPPPAFHATCSALHAPSVAQPATWNLQLATGGAIPLHPASCFRPLAPCFLPPPRGRRSARPGEPGAGISPAAGS
jgi:hypothetical protein